MQKRHFVLGFQTRNAQKDSRIVIHRLGDRGNHRRHLIETDPIAMLEPAENAFQDLHGFLDGLACRLGVDLDIAAWQTVDVEAPAGVDDNTFNAALAKLQGIDFTAQQKSSLGQKRVLPCTLDRLHKHSVAHLSGFDTLEHPDLCS